MSSENKKFEFFETSPEVRSFIYQQLVALEPFLGPETQVNVVAKNPLALAVQLETDGTEIPRSELRKMHRVAIVLDEDGTKIEAEGLNVDLLEAVKQAKNKLLFKLGEIQDSVISQQDRMAQINHYLQASNIH